MGYDCTLHVIDEQAIRERFIPKLLGKSFEATDLDRVIPEAQSLWEQAWAALKGNDPETPEGELAPEETAALICQLAVMFSACSLPHHYERGLAFSLWDRLELPAALQFPDAFAFEPEPLFAAVVAEYPALSGEFYRWFTGNYSTGVYIPAAHVPEVLAWLEATLQALPKGDRRQFKGLLAILRTAAARKLGYWEATDLAVPPAGTLPGDPNLMTASYLQNLRGEPNPHVERAHVRGYLSPYNWSIADGCLVSAEDSAWKLGCWDLTTWPPRHAHAVKEFIPDRARLRDGRWLCFASADAEETPRVFRPRLLGPDWSWQTLPPVVIDDQEISVSDGGAVGGRLIVFRSVPWNLDPSQPPLLAPPLMLAGANWVPCPGLAPAPARPSVLEGSIDRPVCATVSLADGSDVLLWDGDGYEDRHGRFECTFPLAARRGESSFTSVLAGQDGFFYLADRRLYEAHRGQPPLAHVPAWTNIMYLFPGPKGSIIVREGNNPDGDAAKLYFPHDGTFIHIEPELFDDHEYSFVYWSQASDRFLVQYGGEWLALRTAVVLSQPRFRAVVGNAI